MILKPNRRAFLKGAAGITIGLPLAEFAFDLSNSGKLFAQDNIIKTPRLLNMYFPNGCLPEFWNYETALTPLADVRDKIVLFVNTSNPVKRDNTDGHEEGAASLWTGRTLLNDQKGTGISMDQWLSRRIDKETMLKRPLVTGVWRGFAGGQFRSPTWYRRSWMENGDPVDPYVKPLEIFKILFGDSSSIEEKKSKFDRQKSILDSIVLVYKNQLSVNSKLPSSHKDALTAHLEKIRELEKRVVASQEGFAQQCQVPSTPPSDTVLDSGNLLPYSEFEKVYKLQMDLMVLAFQCGATNTGNMMFCCAGEEFVTDQVHLQHTDHGTSHFGDAVTRDRNIKYRQYHAKNLRYMMDKLKTANLLDSTTILWGSEFGDSRGHVRDPQPILLAGGGGDLKMNQVVDMRPSHHTSNDIWATVLTALGQKVEKFGQENCNVGHIQEIRKT